MFSQPTTKYIVRIDATFSTVTLSSYLDSLVQYSIKPDITANIYVYMFVNNTHFTVVK